MRDNSFGELKKGILVTNINIYYRLKKSYKRPPVKNVLKLEKIQSIDIDCRMFGAWLMVNNEKEALISGYSTGVLVRETNVLREILQIIVKEIQLRYSKQVPRQDKRGDESGQNQINLTYT